MSFTYNQRATSWSNVSIDFSNGASVALQTIDDITYGTEIERGEQRGAGQDLLDYTDGRVKYTDAQVTMGVADWANFLNFIGGEPGLRSVRFNIHVNYGIGPQGQDGTYQETLVECGFTKVEDAAKEGPDALKKKVSFKIKKVKKGSNDPKLNSLSMQINF